MKKVLSIILSVCLFLSIMPLTAYAIEADTAPPEIHIDTFTMTLPDGKDTVTIGDKIEYSIEVTDESEISWVEAYYYNYDAGKGETFYFKYNAQSGRFEYEKTIDNDTVSGKWTFCRFWAEDICDNDGYYYNSSYTTSTPNSDLSAFNFTVTGTNPDITPPEIHINTFTMTLPDGKDTVTVGDTVKFSVEVTDENEIDYVEAYYYNYAAEKGENFYFQYNSQSGMYEYEKTVDEDTVSGEWTLCRFWMEDIKDNDTYYYNTSYSTNEPSSDLSAFSFTVTGTNPDTDPPVINIDSLTMTLPEGKSRVIVGDKIKLSVEVTDENDIDWVEAYYYNYAARKSETLSFRYNSQSGKYECEKKIGENTATGEWTLCRFWTEDCKDNDAYYYSTAYSTNEPNSDLSAFNFTVAETCKITFDTRGGTPVDPIYVEKGTKAKAPDYPEKEGFTFGSWYKNADLTGYFSFSYYTVDEDMTLYAGWSIMCSISNWNKTASEEGSGGGYVMGSVGWYTTGCSNISLDESGETLRLSAIPDTGYIFTGWYKGVYTGNSSGQSAEPLDLDNPGTLVSTQPSFDFTVDKYSVIIAVFEECTNHDWNQIIEKGSPEKDGKIYQECSLCGKKELVAGYPKADIYTLSQSEFTYTGKACEPKVTVARTGEEIAETQYDVTYSDNINAGTATALVTFKGDYYEGTKTVTFKINKAANTLRAKGKKPSVKAAKLKKKNQTVKRAKALTVRNAQGAVTYKKAKGNKKITVAKNGKITVKKGLKKGTYKVKIKVTAAGNSNYNKATKTVTVTIKVK